MSRRVKTISWMLLVIIVIGIVAILTRTPVRSDVRSAGEAPAAVDTSPATDTTPADTAPADTNSDADPHVGAEGAQNSSQ